jgi:hypothetical protein
MVHASLFRSHRVGASPFHRVGQVFRALLGLAIMASLLVVALMVAFGVLAWALLRGRRPVMAGVLRRGGWVAGRPGVPPRSAASQASTGDVIDIEAHEVPARPAHR